MIKAAPDTVELAGLRVTLAAPEELVSAVAGLIVAKAASVLKVTTAPETAAPEAFFT